MNSLSFAAGYQNLLHLIVIERTDGGVYSAWHGDMPDANVERLCMERRERLAIVLSPVHRYRVYGHKHLKAAGDNDGVTSGLQVCRLQACC